MLLSQLRARGVTRFTDLRFKENRRTIVSASRDGRTLYLHAAFRRAPESVVADLAAVLRRRPGGGGAELRRIRAWIADTPELHSARSRPRPRSPGRARGGGAAAARSWSPPACAGTGAQQRYLRALYGRLNRERFGALLPAELHLRLSRRMFSRLGHVRTRRGRGGTRVPLELALSIDLLMEGNEAHLLDTMLHEMAHVEDALVHGGRTHGPSWKRIARRVGCAPRACTRAPVIRRPARGARVVRVPPMPTSGRIAA